MCGVFRNGKQGMIRQNDVSNCSVVVERVKGMFVSTQT